MSTYSCCFPESGKLLENVKGSYALNLEQRGILCAPTGSDSTVRAMCPGVRYYPYTTPSSSTGVDQCSCVEWSRPPAGFTHEQGFATKSECMSACSKSNNVKPVSPNMPVDMIGGKCVASSNDLADYPSYLGGLKTCCAVAEAEGYDADAWGDGSLCNRLYPQEKVWLQVPWNDGVQELCRLENLNDVKASHPGIQECSVAYRNANPDNLPYCYISRKQLPNGPQVHQCWSAEGMGVSSEQCPGGQCGTMASCVPYPANSAGPGNTCTPSSGTIQNCNTPNTSLYTNYGENVGYVCDKGNISCVTEPIGSSVPLAPSLYALLNDPGSYNSHACSSNNLPSTCPSCPAPGGASGGQTGSRSLDTSCTCTGPFDSGCQKCPGTSCTLLGDGRTFGCTRM